MEHQPPRTDGLWVQCVKRLTWRWDLFEFSKQLGLDPNDDATKDLYQGMRNISDVILQQPLGLMTEACNIYLAWEVDNPYPS